MPAVGQITLFNIVAVGQQDGIAGFIRLNTGAETGHHIGPVRKVRNAAEAFGFTLGTEHARRFVQTFQARVVLGFDPGHDPQIKLIRHFIKGEFVVTVLVGAALQGFAIQAHRFKCGQAIAVELKALVRGTTIGVPAHGQGAMNPGPIFKQFKTQIHMVHQKDGHTVILEENGLWLTGTHSLSPEFVGPGSMVWEDPEADFITGVFTDIDNTGIQDQVLALDPLEHAVRRGRLVQIMSFYRPGPYLDRIAQSQPVFVDSPDTVLTVGGTQFRQVVGDQFQHAATFLNQIQLRHVAFKHGPPVGSVRDVLLARDFHKTC